MYEGTGDKGLGRPSDSYSWYCGYDELIPFWNMLVAPLLLLLSYKDTTMITQETETDTDNNNQPQQQQRKKEDIQILVVGTGNDETPVQLYDEGWENMIAFDYSQSGLDRAQVLFGKDRSKVQLLQADARQLPLSNDMVDVVFDKGTLDVIYINEEQAFYDSIAELTRVMAPHGILICVSAVIPQEDLLAAFDNHGSSATSSSNTCSCEWDTLFDGDLAFAPDGEATIDLGAQLYAFRKLWR